MLIDSPQLPSKPWSILAAVRRIISFLILALKNSQLHLYQRDLTCLHVSQCLLSLHLLDLQLVLFGVSALNEDAELGFEEAVSYPAGRVLQGIIDEYIGRGNS